MPIFMLLFLVLAMPLQGAADAWDFPPVKYSDTPAQDRLARLAEEWSREPGRLKGTTPLARAREILAALEIPEASQVLVFSKTSKQNGLIHPGNPRALYFSKDAYCGYVPGGVMEIAIHDKNLGPVFYVIDLGNAARPPRVERDTSDCLSCHATGRTEHVPGMMVRSVYPDENGHLLLSKGSEVITHQTPVEDRWGGYFVTGSISLPHLGNRVFSDGRAALPEVFRWKDLSGKIDTNKYPRATSDVVALMVLEHQCHAHNLLTAASMNYRRAWYLGRALDPDGDHDSGSAGRVADAAAERIVEWFLFKDEAGQGEDGVEGDADFQKQFEAAVPRASNGDSLADFHLNGRLFKHRCSYMIYSDAFRELPPAVKRRVLSGLESVLKSKSADDGYSYLSVSERRKIAAILRQTGIW